LLLRLNQNHVMLRTCHVIVPFSGEGEEIGEHLCFVAVAFFIIWGPFSDKSKSLIL